MSSASKTLALFRSIAVLPLLCCALLTTARSTLAQGGDATFHEIGVQQCALCHYSGGNPILEQFGVTEFVGLDETHQWLAKDRHFLAYQLIDPKGDGESNQLSRRMCEKLGIDVATFGEASNTQARDCLSCHAGWTDPQSPPSQAALQFGVRCESCHGNASVWAQPEHHQQPTWRTISPQEKLDKYGMKSLSQPIQRANVCYSCHIGNLAENKVVTHAMYAAGHPPLPSIELASHSEGMGKHWRALDEKGDSFAHRDEYLRAHHPYLAKDDGGLRSPSDDLPQTRMLLVGGALAIDHSVRLLQAQAQDTTRRWPDFAAYDCAACHHELRIDSDRQPVSVSADEWLPPGRPLSAVWPTVTSRVAARLAGADVQSENRIRSLRQILAEKPFGFREKIADDAGAATLLQTDFQALARQLAVRPLAAEDGITILRILCDSPADHRERADFESARQRAWAIEVVSNELQGKAEFTSDRAAFHATLEQLRSELMLRLPNDARTPRRAGDPEDQITRQRTIRLEASDRYSAARFEEQLARLRGLLVE